MSDGIESGNGNLHGSGGGGEARTDWVSLVAVLLAFALAVGVVSFLSLFGELPSGAPLLALVMLAAPLLVYAITSGLLAELHTPGGLTFVFRKAAAREAGQVDLTPLRPVVVGPEDPRVLRPMNRPNSLHLELTEDWIDRQLCLYLWWARERGDAIRWLVITQEGRFRGFIPLSSIQLDPELTELGQHKGDSQQPPVATHAGPDSLQRALDSCRATQLVVWLKEKNAEQLGRLLGYVDAHDPGRAEWTRSQLLRAMFERRIDTIPVLDATGDLRGVAERSRITETILIEMARKTEPRPRQQRR
jgi:hypothetical protein